MNLIAQHSLDAHRLDHTGQAPPPAPGTVEGAALLRGLDRLRRVLRRPRTARAG